MVFPQSLTARPVALAMAVDETVPIVACDARQTASTKQTLITVVEHAMRRKMAVAAGA